MEWLRRNLLVFMAFMVVLPDLPAAFGYRETARAFVLGSTIFYGLVPMISYRDGRGFLLAIPLILVHEILGLLANSPSFSPTASLALRLTRWAILLPIMLRLVNRGVNGRDQGARESS